MPNLRCLIIAGGTLSLIMSAGTAFDSRSSSSASAKIEREDSLYWWRVAESKKTRKFTNSAVVIPQVEPLPITVDRMAYEAEIFSNPANVSVILQRSLNARAEASPSDVKTEEIKKYRVAKKRIVIHRTAKTRKLTNPASSYFAFQSFDQAIR